MRRSNKYSAARAIAAAVGLATMLAACSDIYYDRRETVLFGADDAVAANKAVQTIDPWPRQSADRNVPGNGALVAAAITRYRTGKVYPPRGNGTSTSYSPQSQQSQQTQQSGQGQASGAASTDSGIPTK
jgi:hypothetical protein